MRISQVMMLPCALLLANCGSADSNNGDGGDEGVLEGEIDSAESDGWSFAQRVDPMNDNNLAIAKKSIDSGEFTVETELTCVNESAAYFAFKFFDKGGSEAPLNIKIGQRPFGGGPIEVVYVQARADNDRPTIINAVGMRSINQLSLDLRAHYLATGTNVTLRFPLMAGDVTLRIDMTDPVIQKAMAPCAANMRGLVKAKDEFLTAARKSKGGFDIYVSPEGKAFQAKQDAQEKREADERSQHDNEAARRRDLEAAEMTEAYERGRQDAIESDRLQAEQIRRAYEEQENN